MLRFTVMSISVLAVALGSAAALAAEARLRGEDSSLYLESDRDAEKLLDAARAAARAGHWRQAVEAYQRVADFAGKAGAQPLVAWPPAAGQAEPTLFVPIQEAAARELAGLPKPALELYREGHDAAARAAFERALAAKDASLLAAVAQRYLASSWGDDALAALGLLALERGDFVGALAAWGRLLERTRGTEAPPTILARVWVCYGALGQERAAEAVAARLRAEHAAATLRVGGQDVSVEKFLARKPPAGSQAAGAPAFGELGGLAWRFPLPYAAPRVGRASVPVGGASVPVGGASVPVGGASVPRVFGQSPPYPVALPLHATVWGDRVFLADHGAVYALSLESGQPVWLFPDAPEAGPLPALDETIHAVACSDGRAFARLGQCLFAFDAATGRLLWRRAFAEEKPPAPAEEPEPKGEGKEKAPPRKKGRDKAGKALGSKVTLLLTPPVAAGQRLFVGYTHLGEEARTSLVALDAASGQEVWRTFVCSRTIPAFLGLGASASPPAVSGNTAYFATNLGTVAAVDAATGAIRWVHRYKSFPSHLRRSVLERNERWASGPPIVDGGLVFVAPQDSGCLLALDAAGGEAIWSAPREEGRFLAGVEGNRIFAVGSQVVAMDKFTGKRLWATELPAAVAARPALCQGRLYVPTDGGILAVRTDDGGVSTCHVWQPFEEPGNLTMVDRALLVASRDRLYAFNDWAGTQAALEARRKADPADPLVPLTLGQHEAQRGAHAAAVPHLKEALRLATAKKDAEAIERARQALFEACRALGPDGLASALAYAPGPQEAVGVLLELAALHEREGRPAEAVAALQKIIEQQGSAVYRNGQGLKVAARALACAEIGRIIAGKGRAAYAAAEAEAARHLAAAKTDAELERCLRRFPNSAAAEQALLRLAASPDAKALAPHLASLAGTLAAEPASESRATAEAMLREVSPVGGASVPRGAQTPRPQAIAPRWQVQTRIAHQKVQVVSFPGATPGLLYVASARRSFDRAMPFDSLECRRADTGQLLWQRELSEWDALGAVAGGQLLVATFDQVLALDALTGVERWSASLAEAPDAEKAEPEVPPVPRPKRRPRLIEPGEGPWRPWERRRAESNRIVALAAGKSALYASLAGGRVTALALADGEKVWSRQLDAKALLAHGLFVHDGKVWACAESPGGVYALSEKDGSGNQAVAFPRDETAFRLPRITDRPAHVAAQGRLYVVVDDHAIHAIDLGAGRALWEAYLEASVNRVLTSADGKLCLAVPDGFLHNAQVASLDPDTGKVRRRRSVLAGVLVDAALAPGALYMAERDNDNALVVRALDAADLGERWRTAPLNLAQPSGIAQHGGLLAVAGRHDGQRVAILIHTASGRIIGDVSPKGANELSAAVIAAATGKMPVPPQDAGTMAPGGTGFQPVGSSLLVLGTDRGIHAYGLAEPQALDERIATLNARFGSGDRAALAPLAAALYQRGDERHAIALLNKALADEELPAADYATLKDQLNSLRESLAAREPAAIETAYMDVPPHVDGAINERWRADLAARLDGPAFIDEVQGIPIPEARWRSPSDLSAVLYTGWDAKHFYFAVDVSDDVHRTYTGQTDTWIGDGLIISIDCDNDGGYGYRFTGKDLLLTLALTRKDERRDDEGDDEPSGEYRVRLKDDNSGAVYEIALPWDYLGIEDPRPGLRFGFNVTVTDDDGDRAVKAISWTPGMTLDRDRALMIRGFAPAYFGDVLLTGPRPGPPPLWSPPPPPRDDATRVYRIKPSKER
ncbi:MAG: hypothetical protein FJ291_14000 [Planctomycetes bacterium]|nr:hypothetical protein [Planctomycetota bacterium]